MSSDSYTFVITPKKSLFNFNFKANISLDSLLKAEVGNMVGIGGAVGGKLDINK